MKPPHGVRDRTSRSKIGVGGLVLSRLAKSYVNQVLRSNRLSYGPFSKRFESAFAQEHDVRFASFMNSGTDALRIALAALKAKYRWRDGDEVIVPAVTFVATANIVLQNQMNVVFADVDPLTYNIDPAQLKRRVTKRTRAVIPVHLMGLPCDMKPIWEICRRHKLKIIEDSCETMFATYYGKKVGSLGDIGAFSTYVAHYLETGVGGLTTTDDPDLAVRIKSLMNHGRDSIYLSIDDDKGKKGNALLDVAKRRFRFVRLGYSSRCTEMEAAIGLAQLQEKNTIVKGRRRIAEQYTEAFRDLQDQIQLPMEPKGRTHMYMLYPLVLRHKSKWGLIRHLESQGVETRELMPMINQPIYRKLFGNLEKKFPVARWINQGGLYLGCHQFLTAPQQSRVITSVRSYLRPR